MLECACANFTVLLEGTGFELGHRRLQLDDLRLVERCRRLVLVSRRAAEHALARAADTQRRRGVGGLLAVMDAELWE